MKSKNNNKPNSLTAIQDAQISQELKAIKKHAGSIVSRSVIFAARTRATKQIIALGFTYEQAKEAVTDAADMVALQVAAQ